jgi:3-methylcrotonyl-CoA carboxylase alpha subunit
LQVEHPVTEAITGLDLVEWQFRIAAGEKLPLGQDEVPLNGHSVEARVYAEDPERGFLPAAGKLVALELPQGEGIRADTGVEAGAEVTPFYDPMIAKVIAHGKTRIEALNRLGEALDRTVALGPRTNVAFLAALTRAQQFRAGDFDTHFIDRNLEALGAVPQPLDKAAAALGAMKLFARDAARIASLTEPEDDASPSPWDAADGFQLSGGRVLSFRVKADGETVTARVAYGNNGPVVTIGGVAAANALSAETPEAVFVLHKGRQTKISPLDVSALDAADSAGGGTVRAPMHGKVLAILVEDGERVVKGQRVAIIEAMKMEHSLAAPIEGVVAGIAVAVHGQAAEGARIMTIEPGKTDQD